MVDWSTPWLMIWKKPRVEEEWWIWWMIVERGPDRSITGTVSLGRVVDTGLGRVSGGWWKKRGMVLMPESRRPLTPSLESSNCLTSLSRSYEAVESVWLTAADIVRILRLVISGGAGDLKVLAEIIEVVIGAGSG